MTETLYFSSMYRGFQLSSSIVKGGHSWILWLLLTHLTVVKIRLQISKKE